MDFITEMTNTMRTMCTEITGSAARSQPAKPIKVEIDSFSGDQDRAADWLQEFNLRAANNGWSDDQKAQNAMFKMKGSAKDWQFTTWPGVTPTWDEFCNEFEDHFYPTANRIALQLKVAQMSKRKDENYQTLMNRVRRAVMKAFPNASEVDICQYVLNALVHDKIYQSIIGCEEVRKLNNRLKAVDAAEKMSSKRTDKTDELSKPRSRKWVTPLESRETGRRSDKPLEAQESTPRREDRPTRINYDKLRCANCGQMGHSFRRCDKPKDDERIDRNMAKYRQRLIAKRLVIDGVESEPVDWITWCEEQYALEPESTSSEDEEETQEGFQVVEEIRQGRVITRSVRHPPERVLYIKKDKSLDPITPIDVSGQSTEGLVDSGSNCTMVDETMVEQISQKPYKLGGSRITTITGEDMGLKRVYKDLEFKLKDRIFKVNTIIGKNMEPKVLL